jgi:hypothetical protein
MAGGRRGRAAEAGASVTVRKRKWRDRSGVEREAWCVDVVAVGKDGRTRRVQRVPRIQNRRAADKLEREPTTWERSADDEALTTAMVREGGALQGTRDPRLAVKIEGGHVQESCLYGSRGVQARRYHQSRHASQSAERQSATRSSGGDLRHQRGWHC